MQLESIRKSITDMTYAEGMELIMSIRFNRRQKPPPKKKASGGKRKKKATPKSLVDEMSSNDKAALAAMLKEMM